MFLHRVELLWWLLAAHALTDYVLQPELMGKFKSPLYHHPDRDKLGPWWWSMLAHGLVNGLGVALILHSWGLGVAETIAHAAIDTWKCRGELDTHSDQALHVACKLLWIGLAT